MKSVKKWFSQFGGEELEWPAQSPDHNPINTFRMNWKETGSLVSVADLTSALVAE